MQALTEKPCPKHSTPADEDLYALFRYNAALIARNVSSSIFMHEKIRFGRSRVQLIEKAKKNNVVVKRGFDLKQFITIAEEVLIERHGIKPVHTTEEIKLLTDRFPDNIKLFASFKDDVMLGGTIIYESKNVVHAQYGVNSKEDWDLGALDIVYDFIINNYCKGKRYFDFGISTEKAGNFLNVGLVCYKESF